MSTGVLGGLFVLDFGQGVAGPYCGQLLADHGADVVKVEPARGDWARQMGQRNEHGLSGTFVSVNRNKKGISLDLKDPDSAAVARQLAEQADVIIESFRPGTMDRFDLDYATVASRNAGLIYGSVTGFGKDGPGAGLPAGDSTMQAYGGLMSVVGEPGRQPLRVGNVVSDMIAGTNLFSGVLLALLRREATGEGAEVSTSLLDSMVAFQAPPLTEYLMSGKLPGLQGNQHPLIAPSGLFSTSDGSVVLTVLGHQWASFCRRLGVDELIDDTRFASSNARQINRAELNLLLGKLFERLSTHECLSKLRAADVLCSAVNDYRILQDDPQVVHNELFSTSAGPGRVPMIRNPLSGTGSESLLADPPLLGEHTGQVLRDRLGWEEGRITSFLGGAAGAG